MNPERSLCSLQSFSLLFYLYLLAYLSSYHEKATKRCTSSLRSCRPSVYHTEMGNPVKCLFQQHSKRTCRLLHTVPLMLNVKQGSCEYQFLSHWFDPTWNQTQVYRSRNRHSIRFYFWFDRIIKFATNRSD